MNSINNNITLFLDLDGVLSNTRQYYTNRKKWHPMYNCYKFDEKCVKVLNEILDKFPLTIILSSDWKSRYSLEQLNDIFKWNKVNCNISDITPDLWGVEYFSLQELEVCRAVEIRQYIDGHKIEKFFIIDDLDLLPWFPDNFVRTPKSDEGIKQSGIKDKISNKLNLL